MIQEIKQGLCCNLEEWGEEEMEEFRSAGKWVYLRLILVDV